MCLDRYRDRDEVGDVVVRLRRTVRVQRDPPSVPDQGRLLPHRIQHGMACVGR